MGMPIAHFCTLAITFVCAAHTNKPLYPYVDDQVPHQCAQVATLRKQYRTVVAGVPQGTPNHKCAGALNALEWYPYWRGSFGFPAPCGHKAYILQWKFAWAPSPPPTRKQRNRLLRQVERCKPKPRLIILY